jgi:hypothetical protein
MRYKNATHPIGMPALPCCCAIVMSRRRTTCFPHKMACFALNASLLASLWDAGRSGLTNRWCRRVAPQPPANGFHASGMANRSVPTTTLGDSPRVIGVCPEWHPRKACPASG